MNPFPSVKRYSLTSCSSFFSFPFSSLSFRTSYFCRISSFHLASSTCMQLLFISCRFSAVSLPFSHMCLLVALDVEESFFHKFPLWPVCLHLPNPVEPNLPHYQAVQIFTQIHQKKYVHQPLMSLVLLSCCHSS